MKISTFTKGGMVVAGVLLLVWCVLMLMGSGGKKRIESGHKDDNRCPECGRVLPRNAKATGICPFCAAEKGPEAALAARDRRQGGLASSPVIPGLLIGAFCLLLAAHLGVSLRRRMARSHDEPEYFYVCPKCGRKLRYRQRQIGHAGKCPLCRRVFMFPRPLTGTGKPSLLQSAAQSLRNLVSRKAR